MAYPIWSAPIGHAAELVPAGIPVPAWLLEESVIIILSPGSPLVDGYTNSIGWGAGDRAAEDDIIVGVQFPIPSDFAADDIVTPVHPNVPNNPAAILLADSVTMYERQPFHRAVEGGDITFYEGAAEFQYEWSEGGDEGAHGGSAMSAYYGTIFNGQVDQQMGGPFKVLLNGAAMSSFGDGFRFPANTADTGFEDDYTGSVPACRMGSLLCLAPDFDIDSLETPMAQWLALNWKQYGSYVVDQRVDDAMAICLSYGPGADTYAAIQSAYGRDLEQDLSDTGDAFARDMNVIIPALMVVNNNELGNEGGGGEPVIDGDGGGGGSGSGTWQLGGYDFDFANEPEDGSVLSVGRQYRWARYNPHGYSGTIMKYLGRAGNQHTIHLRLEHDAMTGLRDVCDSSAESGTAMTFVAPRDELRDGILVVPTRFAADWHQGVRGDDSAAYWWDVWIDLQQVNETIVV